MMKNGTVQLCFLIVAITGMHAAKIMRSSPNKIPGFPANKVRNALLLTKIDSLNANTGNNGINVAFHPDILNTIKTQE